MSIVEPIFGIELDSGDVNVFMTQAAAESYVEFPDLDNWLLFDVNGRVLKLSVEAGWGGVRLASTEECDKERLLGFVTAYLVRIKT